MNNKTTVFLSYPVHNTPMMKSVLSVFNAISSSRYCQVKFTCIQGDSFIQRVRNEAVTEFVGQIDFDYFCTIDSDITLLNSHPDDNLFDILLKDDRDFVGGLYSLKDTRRICSSLDIEGKREFSYNSGIIEMKWLSAGCHFIRRKVIMDMVQAYKDQQYVSDALSRRLTYGLYNPYIYEIEGEWRADFGNIAGRKLLSEDWAFVQRAKDIGYRIYADTRLLLLHENYTLFPEAYKSSAREISV